MSDNANKSEPRQTGTAGHGKSAIDTPSIPDPQTKNRPLTPDEKVDEAALESMDGSDAPAFQPSATGAGPDRKSDHKPQTPPTKDKAAKP